MKTLIDNNNNSGGTLSYVRHFEVVHPEIGLTMVSKASFPAIFLTPISSSEQWISSQEKESLNEIHAFLIIQYLQRESSIIGDSTRPEGHGKGIIDFVNDFLTVFRGHTLGTGGTAYLNKPLDISNVDYFADNLGENANIMVAQIVMQCSRLFLQTSIPVNV
jgi:hypothetical protein